MADTLFPPPQIESSLPHFVFNFLTTAYRVNGVSAPGTHRNTQHPVVSFWERCFAIIAVIVALAPAIALSEWALTTIR